MGLLHIRPKVDMLKTATVDGNPTDSRKNPNPPFTSPGRQIPKLSAETQILYDLITRVDISLRQISSEIALLRIELAQKPSYEEMHKYVDVAFLDLNSRLQKIEEKYTQTSQQTDDIREIVREETFCHHDTQRRIMNIIVKKIQEQEGVDDVIQVKPIIKNQLQDNQAGGEKTNHSELCSKIPAPSISAARI
ncbi:hypothetical protein QYM36_009544 [Artemia franciscana]|uniref:Uncharacterized protein n=1 Tax=Artemia franciscana TaxID=6661 RepID=A0AA88HWZ8_ARTSF|nr:hypothetical protein QYM36_009544 [Artemia franciscana]